MPRDRLTAVRSATAALLVLAACGDAPDRPSNLVILLSDTHRPDFTGYRPADHVQLEPRVERIGREATQFSQAFTPTPISTPAS